MIAQYPGSYHRAAYFEQRQQPQQVQIRRHSVMWGGVPQIQGYRVRAFEYEDLSMRQVQFLAHSQEGVQVYNSNQYAQENADSHFYRNQYGGGQDHLRLPDINEGTNPRMLRSKSTHDLRQNDYDDSDSDDGLAFKDRIHALKKRHARERGELTKKQAFNRAQMDQNMSHKLRERRERRERSEPRRLSVMLAGSSTGSNHGSTRTVRK